ncbi:MULTISPECIES: hypothetical protein [unclassified Corallococcus]|uniref:hypothetical protein n=1 Tax=unclassified Corallococcus TaxID=2685029 RepID=UPI001A8CEA93|nr:MULTISPECIES: hypothetical protein [unclassified Corallococcus]MBN9685730.1 hypothetical protein [Corallococcus sp. NCSPR001]WAS82825.1 hypothetical protein O0N60_26295 [Corallococcus sp. NCRR]
MTDEKNRLKGTKKTHKGSPQGLAAHEGAKNLRAPQAPADWVSRARTKLLEAVQKRALEAPPPKPSSNLSEEMDRRDTVRRVLKAIFSDTTPANAVRFRRALETSPEETAAVLTSFNVENGQNLGELKFNSDQNQGLNEILLFRKFAPIAPVEKDGVTVKRQVLHFWTELLSKQTAQVEDLHLRVSDYAADRNDASKCERVLETLRQYAPEGAWNREHVDALAEINTESIQFKSLAWLHFPGVIW